MGARQRIVRLDLPPSRKLHHLKAERLLLVHVVTCNATKNEASDQWEYSTMGKTHFIDLNLVQCSVGRIFDQGKWTFIDRSGPTAHIEIASPVTSSQSSLTDFESSDSPISDFFVSPGSAGMSQESPLCWSPNQNEDPMSTSSLSDSMY